VLWGKERCVAWRVGILENTVVDQGIMNDEVGLAEEMADSGHVGGMPAHKDKAVLGSIKSAISFSISRCSGLRRKQDGLPKRTYRTVDGVFGGLRSTDLHTYPGNCT